MDPEGEFLRPATKIERIMELMNKNSTCLLCYNLTLNSSEEIEDDQFKQAFIRLAR